MTCSNETQGIQMTPFDVDVRRALRAYLQNKDEGYLPGGTNEIFVVMIGVALTDIASFELWRTRL